MQIPMTIWSLGFASFSLTFLGLQEMQIVMLQSMAGPGVDLTPGDVCECSTEHGQRFIAAGLARSFTKGDEGRKVKQYGVKAAAVEAVADEEPATKGTKRATKK